MDFIDRGGALGGLYRQGWGTGWTSYIHRGGALGALYRQEWGNVWAYEQMLKPENGMFLRGSVSLAGFTTGLVSISISLGRFSWSISSFVFNYKEK